MALTPCLDCGKPARSTRCPSCQAHASAPRNARKAQRYDAEHEQARRHWARHLNAGGMVRCARCGKPVTGRMAWDLDHLPTGESRPSHAFCNRSAGARLERGRQAFITHSD